MKIESSTKYGKGKDANRVFNVASMIGQVQRALEGRDDIEATVDARLRTYFQEIDCIPLLSLEDERSLAELAMQGDIKARNQLIEHNLRLVVKVAYRYAGRGMNIFDLIQEGNIGLMHAAEKYKLDHGTKFSSYAFWWINQCIVRALEEKTTYIRLPSYAYQELLKVKQAHNRFLKTSEREPDLAELAEMVDINVERVEALLRASLSPTSLSMSTFGGDGDISMEQMLFNDGETTEETVLTLLVQDEVQGVIQQVLAPRERKIIQWRYGLWGAHPHTLEELRVALGVSRERIRQIETKALKKLRESDQMKKMFIAL